MDNEELKTVTTWEGFPESFLDTSGLHAPHRGECFIPKLPPHGTLFPTITDEVARQPKAIFRWCVRSRTSSELLWP
jgi:hypothetical protein